MIELWQSVACFICNILRYSELMAVINN